MARPTVDLPEPLSPTMPTFSRPTAKRDAAHRLDDARGRREAHAEVLDLEERVHGVYGRPACGPFVGPSGMRAQQRG